MIRVRLKLENQHFITLCINFMGGEGKMTIDNNVIIYQYICIYYSFALSFKLKGLVFQLKSRVLLT